MKTPQIITGTTGQPDYVVVARNGDFVLGLKPLIISHRSYDKTKPLSTIVGFRFRSAVDPTIETKSYDPECFTTAFPNFDFPRKAGAQQRASGEFGILLPIGKAQRTPDTLKSVLAESKFFPKLHTYLTDRLDEDQLQLGAEDLEQIFTDLYTAILGRDYNTTPVDPSCAFVTFAAIAHAEYEEFLADHQPHEPSVAVAMTLEEFQKQVNALVGNGNDEPEPTLQ